MRDYPDTTTNQHRFIRFEVVEMIEMMFVVIIIVSVRLLLVFVRIVLMIPGKIFAIFLHIVQ